MSVMCPKGRFWPGFTWRILAHKRDGSGYPEQHQVEMCSEDFPCRVEFDELVIDHWLHIEQMSDRHWWFRIGNYAGGVTIARDGTPSVHFYEEETPGESQEAFECWRKVRSQRACSTLDETT